MTSHVAVPQAVTLPEASSEAGSPAHSGPRTVALPTEPVLPPPLCCGPQELHQPPAGQSHRPLCCGNSETAWPQGHRHPPTPCLSREERPGSTGLSVAERTPAGHAAVRARAWRTRRQGRASTTATCVSPDVQASPAEGLQEHPSLAVTAGSLCWAGLGKALQSAGGRAEHKCPQGHYGAAQEMATTPRTWRQGHGADPFSLKASFPGARGPPPPQVRVSPHSVLANPCLLRASRSLGPPASPSQPHWAPLSWSQSQWPSTCCSLFHCSHSAPSWARAPPGPPHLRWGTDECPDQQPPNWLQGPPGHSEGC